MSDPERLISEALERAAEGMFLVDCLRKVAATLGPTAPETLRDEATTTLKEVMAHPQGAALLERDSPFYSVLGGPPGFIDGWVDRGTRGFRVSIDAASLVIAHSFADAVADLLCKASIAAAPEAWARHVRDKTFRLRDLDHSTPAELTARALRQYASALSRESLPTRLDLLLKVCKPSREQLSRGTHRYSRDRLIRLDKLRHAVVHESAPGAGPRLVYHVEHWPNPDEDLRFLGFTLAIMTEVVAARHAPNLLLRSPSQQS